MTINSGFARPAQGGLSAVIPLRPGEPSPQSLAASRRRNVIMVVIGLAAAARLAREGPGGKQVILVVIVLAAATGLGREGLGNLAGWYKRQAQRN
ncbi:MAG TPA: hypothetical protein VII22_03420 [Streptosporangiaceae bacterium]